MASSTGTFCDICQNRHISKAAEQYCPFCEEALCTDCNVHHKVSRATKSHQVISIDEYNKLPPFIREIKQYCDEHDDRFEFFCPTHEELCCKRCIATTHNECKGYQVIDDFVDKYSKSSAAIDGYEQTLEDVEENIQTAIVDRKNNLEEFEKQEQAIIKQIKNERIEINKHFDNLEAAIMTELVTIKGEKKQNVKSVIEQLEENKTKNLQLRKDVDAMKKYGSNIQVFMGTIKLQQPVSSHEKFARSLQDDESIRFINLECSISAELDGIVKGVRSFGVVMPLTSKSRVRFSWKSDKSAQILTSPTDMHSIDNLKSKLICEIDVSASATITSCLVGKYVMFSSIKSKLSAGRLLQYDSEGKYLKERKLKSSHAFNMLIIDSDTVAATGGGYDFKVHIIDSTSLQIRSVIDLGFRNWLYGAIYENGSIIACTMDNVIQMFKITNNKVLTVENLPLKTKNTTGTYLASDANNLYHSDYTDGSVTCYDLKGNIVWSFKEDVLQEPRSVCLDSDSNVYVAGSSSNNVVVISSDGLHSKQLLGPDDGINAPHAIHFDKSSNRLLVANEYGPAFLYHVLK